MQNLFLKINCFLFVLLYLPFMVKAQTPLTTYAQMDINNINARSMVLDCGWYDNVNDIPKCEYPKGSGKNIGNAYGVWISAQSKIGTSYQNFVLAESYIKYNNFFWPGPIDSNNAQAVLNQRGYQWAKIWSVDKYQLDSFFNHSFHTISNTPKAILDWPAKGNVFALDALGNPLTINRDLAPFVDLNNNGIYEPLQGDFPKIKGDKMLWWICNDGGNLNYPFINLTPLNVEIINTVYAYKKNNFLDNVIFYEYKITNKSMNKYEHFKMGLFNDFNIGNPVDDAYGFDSLRRLVYTFNANNTDSIYGSQIPVAGIMLLHSSLDSGCIFSHNIVNALNIDHFNNLTYSATHYMYNMSSENPPNNSFYGNLPLHSFNYCDSLTTPSDVKMVINSDTMTLNSNQTLEFTYVLLAASNSSGGCASINLNELYSTADSVKNMFCNPPAPLAINTISVKNNNLSIYPNPVSNTATIQINMAQSGNATVSVIDINGRELTKICNQKQYDAGSHIETFNAANYADGVYFLKIITNAEVTTLRFLIQK